MKFRIHLEGHSRDAAGMYTFAVNCTEPLAVSSRNFDQDESIVSWNCVKKLEDIYLKTQTWFTGSFNSHLAPVKPVWDSYGWAKLGLAIWFCIVFCVVFWRQEVLVFCNSILLLPLAGVSHMILHSTGGSPLTQIFGIVENRPRYRNLLSN